MDVRTLSRPADAAMTKFGDYGDLLIQHNITER
jgi:hypothetical protein